ncbi:hypothetical protein F1609_08085 [Massilia sp. CCM 8693]|uniref:Phage tail assembly protein n=1 Tax=Massilia aquatica TaxID=2609000 RepID=A0ABX0M0C6_9BURK|nr:hypothetical protein [Massilia aquatica]
MAKPKRSLDVSPTFKAAVTIPRAGSDSFDIEFVFKHRTKAELKEFSDAVASGAGDEDAKDSDVLLDIASGWDLDEPFDADSLEKLTQRFMGSTQAVLSAYFFELSGARAKN